MNDSSSHLPGRLAIFIGVCILFGVVFYMMSFRIYNVPLLKISILLILAGTLLDRISDVKTSS